MVEPIRQKIKIAKNESLRLQQLARERTFEYILAAVGLVAALAWNDAIKAFIDFIFPVHKNSIYAKFLYAILMTGVVVVISAYLVRLFKKDDDQKKS